MQLSLTHPSGCSQSPPLCHSRPSLCSCLSAASRRSAWAPCGETQHREGPSQGGLVAPDPGLAAASHLWHPFPRHSASRLCREPAKLRKEAGGRSSRDKPWEKRQQVPVPGRAGARLQPCEPRSTSAGRQTATETAPLRGQEAGTPATEGLAATGEIRCPLTPGSTASAGVSPHCLTFEESSRPGSLSTLGAHIWTTKLGAPVLGTGGTLKPHEPLPTRDLPAWPHPKPD